MSEAPPKKCLSCGALIFPEKSKSIPHITLLKFNAYPADPVQSVKAGALRVDYCIECFKNNADPVAIAALELNTKIEPRASNDSTEYENAPVTEPLDHTTNWYCPDCHCQLNLTLRRIVTSTNGFYCSWCNKQQTNICYYKKACKA